MESLKKRGLESRREITRDWERYYKRWGTEEVIGHKKCGLTQNHAEDLNFWEYIRRLEPYLQRASKEECRDRFSAGTICSGTRVLISVPGLLGELKIQGPEV